MLVFSFVMLSLLLSPNRSNECRSMCCEKFQKGWKATENKWNKIISRKKYIYVFLLYRKKRCTNHPQHFRLHVGIIYIDFDEYIKNRICLKNQQIFFLSYFIIFKPFGNAHLIKAHILTTQNFITWHRHSETTPVKKKRRIRQTGKNHNIIFKVPQICECLSFFSSPLSLLFNIN